MTPGARYAALAEQFGTITRRQLVSSLQVHVAIRGADRALAVHNALRSYLPEIAALAAHAPFHDGRDTGLASIRPIICTHLPRQGVPPPIASWEAHAEALALIGDPGRGGGSCGRTTCTGRSSCGCPTPRRPSAMPAAVAAVAQSLAVCAGPPARRRRGAAGRRVVADRPEPLLGAAPRPGRDDDRPVDRRARADGRADRAAARRARAGGRGARLRGRTRRDARALLDGRRARARGCGPRPAATRARPRGSWPTASCEDV